MAMLFMDGFDYLTTGNIPLKWDSQAFSPSLITGIYGQGKAVQNSSTLKTLAANVTEGFQGFHLFYGVVGTGNAICAFLDAGSIQVDLVTDATGALFFRRGGSTTIGSVGAPSTRLVGGSWYWIETRLKVDPTAGIAECKVNGAFVLNSGVTNLNTRNSANSFFNQVKISTPASTSAFDSYHCWDTNAGDVTTYMGEHAIDTKLANGAGSNAAWTPNTGTNFSRVNEANEDGDTSYVSSATANQIDSYAFANLVETTGTIATIAVNTIDRVDDATPRTFDHFVKSSSATALSSAFSPNASYINHQSFFGTDPNTSAAWTIAGRNAAEFGEKLIS